MDPKDRRLILAIVLAVVAWIGVDLLFSPKPKVFLFSGNAPSVYQAATATKGGATSDPIDPSTFLPQINVRQVVNTVYEKPYQEFFAQNENRDRSLSMVLREPVIELSATNDPTVRKREGGSFTVSLRVKAYNGPVYDMHVDFLGPRGWEYIPGTITNRVAEAEDVLTKKLASLEDRVEWARGRSTQGNYLADKVVEPTVKVPAKRRPSRWPGTSRAG
jgi:hypothetical protein